MSKETKKNVLLAVISTCVSFSIFLLILLLIVKHDRGKNTQYFTNLDWDDRDINDIPTKRNLFLERVVQGVDKKYTVRTNNEGLRDYEYPLVKPAQNVRVALVGDSVTFGAGLNLEDTYAKQLERLLNNHYTKKIEVINFGASGASTINELELITKKVLLYNPDILLLQMDPNDCDLEKQIKKIDPFLNKIIIRLKDSGLELSQWLKCKLELYKYYHYKKNLTVEDQYNNVVNPLKLIIDICRKNKIKFAVFSYDPAHKEDYYPKVMQFIRDQGIPLLDLYQSRFGRLPHKIKYINPKLDRNGFLSDAHPNEFGCEVIAKELFDFLGSVPEISDEFVRQEEI